MVAVGPVSLYSFGSFGLSRLVDLLSSLPLSGGPFLNGAAGPEVKPAGDGRGLMRLIRSSSRLYMAFLLCI